MTWCKKIGDRKPKSKAARNRLKTTIENYLKSVQGPQDDWDLFSISLEICRIVDPALEVRPHRAYLRHLTDLVRDRSGPGADVYKTLNQLNQILFCEQGFRGNSEDYYNPRNSYMSCVLKDRKGIPITLSILYQELARQLGHRLLPVSMPSHFLLRLETTAQPVFLDAFHLGEFLLEEDCRKRFSQIDPGTDFQQRFLEPVRKRVVVMRVLTNLKRIYRRLEKLHLLLEVIQRRIPLYRDSPPEILERGLIHLELKQYRAALQDFQYFVAHTRDTEMRELIQKQLTKLRTLVRLH